MYLVSADKYHNISQTPPPPPSPPSYVKTKKKSRRLPLKNGGNILMINKSGFLKGSRKLISSEKY
jgi:hypothetical protein